MNSWVYTNNFCKVAVQVDLCPIWRNSLQLFLRHPRERGVSKHHSRGILLQAIRWRLMCTMESMSYIHEVVGISSGPLWPGLWGAHTCGWATPWARQWCPLWHPQTANWKRTDEMAELYKGFKVPLWCSARHDTSEISRQHHGWGAQIGSTVHQWQSQKKLILHNQPEEPIPATCREVLHNSSAVMRFSSQWLLWGEKKV